MTATNAEPECGTYAAAQRHKRRGEKVCTPCLVARREYMREYMRAYREKNGTQRDYEYSRAYMRATQRLRALHPAQFEVLLAEERDRT